MRAVQDSVNDDDGNHDNEKDDHVARILVHSELGLNVGLVSLHVGIE